MTSGNDLAYPIDQPTDETNSGLTKREYFAAMAMQGFCVQAIPDISNSDQPEYNQHRAAHAVNMADALIKALNNQSK